MNKSIHQDMLGKGYRAERVIPDSHLAEGLAKLAVDVARDYFLSTRICPADVALSGEHMIPSEPSHIVYTKISPKHPSEVNCRRTKRPYVHFCCMDLADGRTVRL